MSDDTLSFPGLVGVGVVLSFPGSEFIRFNEFAYSVQEAAPSDQLTSLCVCVRGQSSSTREGEGVPSQTAQQYQCVYVGGRESTSTVKSILGFICRE